MFLRAIEGGAQRAAQIAQLQQQRERDRAQARNILSAIGGRGSGFDPLRAAQAEQIQVETDLARQAAAEEAAAAAESARLQSIGVSPQEAFFQSGMHRFGIKPPTTEKEQAEKIFEAGREVISVDPTTGQVRVLHTAPETPRAEPRFAIPFGEALPGSPAPTARLTAKEIRSAWNTLPDFTKNHAITRAILEAFPEGKSDARQLSPAGGQDTLIQEAREAIRQGAPVEAVERELREKYGINVKF